MRGGQSIRGVYIAVSGAAVKDQQCQLYGKARPQWIRLLLEKCFHIWRWGGTSGLFSVLRGAVQGMTNGRQEFVSEIGPRYDLWNRWNCGALLLFVGPAGFALPFYLVRSIGWNPLAKMSILSCSTRGSPRVHLGCEEFIKVQLLN